MPVFTTKYRDTTATLRVDVATYDAGAVAITLMDRTDHAAAVLTPDEARNIGRCLMEAADRATPKGPTP